MANPAIIYPNPSPQSTTSPGNPPAAAGPISELYGLRLIYPMMKQSLSGAVKRVPDSVQYNNGATLANSTTYPGWLALPRNCALTGLWLIAGVVPIGGTNTLVVKLGNSGGTTLLAGASFDPTTLVANVMTPLPLTATSSLLYTFAASGPPPAIYTAYNSGVQGTAAQNVCLFAEFEMDDF